MSQEEMLNDTFFDRSLLTRAVVIVYTDPTRTGVGICICTY